LKSIPPEHRRKRDVETIRKDAIELLGTEKDSTELRALMMLLAMPEIGTSPDTLSKYLEIPRAEARIIAKRFRDNKVWIGNKMVIDEDVDLEDGKNVSIMYIIYSMIGSGIVVRAPDN
jgi:hypothetical protein